MKQNELIELNVRRGFSSARQPMLEAGRFAGLLHDNEAETVRKVERSVAYMMQHVNQPLKVATLATLANVSPSHFFALFKQHMGCSPMDYFTRLRMRHACDLLGSTPASVKEVAAALGYDDPFYFSRVFKSAVAVAPVHYRNLGHALRQEIKNLLEAKDQTMSGDSLRRVELGHRRPDAVQINHV